MDENNHHRNLMKVQVTRTMNLSSTRQCSVLLHLQLIKTLVHVLITVAHNHMILDITPLVLRLITQLEVQD